MFWSKKRTSSGNMLGWFFAGLLIAEVLLAFALVMLRA